MNHDQQREQCGRKLERFSLSKVVG